MEHPGSVAYIKPDTAVGGGLLVNGRVHSGSHRMAGAGEHLRISLDDPNYLCCRQGCSAMYIGPAPSPRPGSDRFAESEGGETALTELDRRVRAGGADAVAALGAAGHALGAAVLGVSGVTDAGRSFSAAPRHWAAWLRPGLATRLAGRRAPAPDMQPLTTFGVLGAETTSPGGFQTCRDAPLDDPTSVPVAPPAPVAAPLP